jgi:hypothetical protein
LEKGAPGSNIFSQDLSVRSMCTAGPFFGVTSLLVLRNTTLLEVGITLVVGIAGGGSFFFAKATPALLATLWMNDPPPVLVEVRVLGLVEEEVLEALVVLLPKEKEVVLLLVVAWVSVVGQALGLLAFLEEEQESLALVVYLEEEKIMEEALQLVLLREEEEENEAGEVFLVAAFTTLLFGLVMEDGLLWDKSLHLSSLSEDKKISPLVNRWFMILFL